MEVSLTYSLPTRYSVEARLLDQLYRIFASNGITVGLEAENRSAVDAAYAAAIKAGGKDEGAPGIRKHYHPNYYGAYVRDLDGNKVCIVCHKPA